MTWSDRARAETGQALADAFLAADWEEQALLAAGAAAFGRRPRWLRRVVEVVLVAYRDRPADQPREFTAFLELFLEQLDEIEALGRRPPPIVRRAFPSPAMGRTRWPVPTMSTIAELAAFFDLHVGELLWLADPRGLERSVSREQLRNYTYVFAERRGAPPRVLERRSGTSRSCSVACSTRSSTACRRTTPRTGSGAAIPR